MTPNRHDWRWKCAGFLWTLFLFFLIGAVLAGCATPSVGRCTPSSDLPAVKVLKKIPENAATPKNLYDLFVDERAEHARDIRDYNSLYRQCVTR